MAKIAIVEDDQTIALMYRLKFESEGYEVGLAKNGRLGLELVEKMRPDIVLLDLMMPEMTGEAMLDQMRLTDWGKNIKVIIMTNVGKEEAPPTLKQLGVHRYIVKAEMTPSQVAELVRYELAEA
ncbi:MAG TPA: response regulator [Verrucomicrobiae bacterium]|nr:response regulator [Verrucomicrobiae bacterium]